MRRTTTGGLKFGLSKFGKKKKTVGKKDKGASAENATKKKKSKFGLKLKNPLKKDWDTQITDEDCLPFNVFLGAILSRACYDPPSVFALNIADTYDSVFLAKWMDDASVLKVPSNQCRDAGKQKAFSQYINTRHYAKQINDAFVGNEARVIEAKQKKGGKGTQRVNKYKHKYSGGRTQKRYGGAKLTQLPAKFYTYDSMPAVNKERLKKHGNWAYMYVHTSEDLSVYLLADVITHSIFIIFRGTRSLQNVKTDLTPHAHILCDPKSSKGDVEEVFKGVYELQDEVLHTIYYSSIWLANRFLKATKNNPVQIWSYGHSLGGASASLFAYMWVGIHDEQQKIDKEVAGVCKPNIYCSTFGAPKVFNQTLNKHFENLMSKGRIQYIRYVTEGDAITSLPPEAKIKKGVLNFTLVHPGKNLGENINVKGKERVSNYSLLKCLNPLSQLKGTAHLVGSLVKRDRSKLKPISFDYDKRLRCTTINYNPKLDINPNAHGIQARIEYMFVLSNFSTGSELNTGSSVKQKTIGKKQNAIMKIFYSEPKTLDMYGHLFNIKAISKAGSDSDNEVISYQEFVKLIGDPLIKSKNDNKLILQNTLSDSAANGADQAVKPSGMSAVEHIDAGSAPSTKDKVATNIEAAKGFDKMTCEAEQ